MKILRLLILTIILLNVFGCSQQDRKNASVNNGGSDSIAPMPPAQRKSDQAPKQARIINNGSKDVTILDVLSHRVSLKIPSAFFPLNEQIFRLKYPLDDPTITKSYGNEDATISLLISPRQDEATLEDLPLFQKKFSETFARNPLVRVSRNEMEIINGRRFLILEMITPAPDSEIFNLMYVTSLEGKLLINSFNCTMPLASQWKTKAYDILNSIRVLD